MSVASVFRKFHSFAPSCLELLCPSYCVLCKTAMPNVNSHQLRVCTLCENILPWLGSSCSICANPFSENTASSVEVCGQCLSNPPLFRKSICLFEYKKPISTLIRQLKFHDRLILGNYFGHLLMNRLKKHYPHSHSIRLIPVPLHEQRLRQRGFNQALEIAKVISRHWPATLDKHSLVRVRATSPQAEIPAKQRRTNVTNAFCCRSDLENIHVLLIDDVITTGHTIHACCTALKKAGVSQIDVCAVARTSR